MLSLAQRRQHPVLRSCQPVHWSPGGICKLGFSRPLAPLGSVGAQRIYGDAALTHWVLGFEERCVRERTLRNCVLAFVAAVSLGLEF